MQSVQAKSISLSLLREHQAVTVVVSVSIWLFPSDDHFGVEVQHLPNDAGDIPCQGGDVIEKSQAGR